MNKSEQYVLAKPLELKDIVYNDMGEPPEYHFAQADASEHELISVGGDYVQSVFVPLSVREQQIRDIIEESTSGEADPQWIENIVAAILGIEGK